MTMNALVLAVVGHLAASRRDYAAASNLLDEGQALLRELPDDLSGFDRLQQQMSLVYVDNVRGQQDRRLLTAGSKSDSEARTRVAEPCPSSPLQLTK